VLRSGQDETSVTVGVAVHLLLEVGQQLGCVLDLVEDGSGIVLGEEATGISASVVSHVQGLEGDMGFVRKGHLTQGRLAGLTRARDRDHRIGRRDFQQRLLEVAFDKRHLVWIVNSTYNLCNSPGVVTTPL